MPELDDLLTGRVSDDAARQAATPPPFGELKARGIRRRRRQRATVMGAAAAAVVVTVVGIQLTGLNRPSQPVDVPRPTPTGPVTPEPRLTAAEVVDHPDARLQRIVVAPGAPETRAALWQVCLDEDCTRSSQALAVTGDGFETRSEIAVPGHAYLLVTPLDDDSFYLGWNRRNQVVVHTDGSTTEVTASDARPLQDGAVLVRTPSFRRPFAGVDPDTGALHPLTVPAEPTQLVEQPDGTLLGTVRPAQSGAATVVWSTDGGVTWQENTLATGEHPLMGLVPSARADVLALVEGSDGATLFPLIRAHRSMDGGQSWETFTFSENPRAYGGGSAVLPDGRLLVHINAWSDQRINRPSSEPVGLHVSEGIDWSDLSPVDVGDPFRTGNSDQRNYEVVGMEATSEGVAVYARRIAVGAATNEVYVSHDAGSTWQELAAR